MRPFATHTHVARARLAHPLASWIALFSLVAVSLTPIVSAPAHADARAARPWTAATSNPASHDRQADSLAVDGMNALFHANPTATASGTRLAPIVPPTSIATQPQRSQDVRLGSTVRLSVSAKGAGLTYQWYRRAPGSIDWRAVTGPSATADTLPVAAGPTFESGTSFIAVVTGMGGVAISAEARITMTIVKTTITTNPFDAVIATGLSKTLVVRARGDLLHYQWYRKGSGDAKAVAIKGATANRFTVRGTASNDNARYFVIASGYRGTAKSSTALMRVVTPTATPAKDARASLSQQDITLQGVDVSRWQGRLTSATNLGARGLASQGWSFVVARLGGSQFSTSSTVRGATVLGRSGSDGLAVLDRQYRNTIKEARAAGLAVGHYWFNGYGDPWTDADYFVAALSQYRPGDPLVLDIEENTLGTDAWTPAQANAFFDEARVKLAARFGDHTPNFFVYMTPRQTRIADWSQVAGANIRLWVAYWGADVARIPTNAPRIEGWKTWTIWQYSSVGLPNGMPGRTDVNVARSDAWTAPAVATTGSLWSGEGPSVPSFVREAKASQR